MTIIGARKFTYILSAALVGASIAAVAAWGLNLGIDFTGGSLLEVEYVVERPAQEEIARILKESAGIENSIIQPTGERGVIMRFRDVDELTHQGILAELSVEHALTEKRFDSIGPTIGAELRQKSLWAISLVIIMIILYISWAFRGVPQPMSSWKFGTTAVIALVHDVAIPVGLFSYLGYFYGVEVDTLFVTALLTILGFSVHDTIVVFDRIRERLKQKSGEFEEIVEQSIRSTIARSINTSITVLFVMAALYFIGGATTQMFSLAIMVGVFFGTYSSIFIASALLVTWHRWSTRA